MIEKAPFCCIPLFDAKIIALISGRSEKSSDIRSALTFSKPERWSICNTFSAKYRERDRNTLKQERFNLWLKRIAVNSATHSITLLGLPLQGSYLASTEILALPYLFRTHFNCNFNKVGEFFQQC